MRQAVLRCDQGCNMHMLILPLQCLYGPVLVLSNNSELTVLGLKPNDAWRAFEVHTCVKALVYFQGCKQ